MDVMLLVNPSSGDGTHTADELRDRITAAGHRVAIGERKGPGLQQALDTAADLVVVAGGDGTVGRVLKAMAGRDLRLAILPLGTANNIARSLGIHGTVDTLIGGWTSASRVHLNVGRVRGPWGETAFVESVGLGLLGRLMSPAGKRGIGDLDEARDRARRLARAATAVRWRVELDGQDRSGDYLLIEATNIRCVGPGVCFPIRPHAHDGWLRVVLAGERDRGSLEALVTGDKVASMGLSPETAKQVRLWCRAEELHVDDVHGTKLQETNGLIEITAELTDQGVEILI